MYDPLEAMLERAIMSDISILNRVDEYSLYCKYLGFEPLLQTSYRSFIRREGQKSDDNPSFSIYESFKPSREYMWKDAGLGESGDIFKLVRMMYGYSTTKEAMKRVCIDFKLDYDTTGVTVGDKLVLYSKPENPPEVQIRVTSQPYSLKDLKYWAAFGVTREILVQYKVKSVKYYWLYPHQVEPNVPSGLAFSYEVLGKYKLYQPFAGKTYKFRNNFHHQCLEGFAQLTYDTDTLIITKASKDVMTLRGLNYDAVAPRGENILIPNEYLNYFSTKYKRILILFDNDMKHKGDEYPYPKIYVPLSSRTKDISDYRKAYGATHTVELLKQLLT